MKPEERLIIAVDATRAADIVRTADLLRETAATIKVGSTAFNANGPSIVRAVSKMDKQVFLDLKLFDIPEQVAGAVRAMTGLGAFMLTVHALGGVEMMAAAKRASRDEAGRLGLSEPLVVAVTILTSLDDTWLDRIGLPGTDVTVPALAEAAREAGLDGVVASAHEVGAIKKIAGQDFLTVVPGVRLPSGDMDDQKRVATPEFALAQGADYLVVGRPITAAVDPVAAAKEILRRMA
jgi:orotidine-5'-phosphate decarboxylase